jgi:LysR family glycine cleavage system transcriptional activator
MKPRHTAPLNALRAFEAAARCLSFRTAAAQLFVTPAAVSHQVKRLEAHLGVELFQRGHRAVELTAEGATLAASLSEIFGMLDLALDRTTAATTADLGVSTMESFAAKWLAPRLHRFHRAHPEIRIRIETGDAHADFARGGVVVAIRYGPGGYAGVGVEHLMDAPVFPVCAPGMLGGRKPLAAPEDLIGTTLIHDQSAEGRDGVPDWPRWFQVAGVTGPEVTAGPVFPSIYLAQEAAIHGHGVALGLAPLVEEDLQRGRLVKPFEQQAANAYAFWVLRRRGNRHLPAAAAFCRWLQEEASATGTLPPATLPAVAPDDDPAR